jgi:hypothetical protein
MTKLQQEEHAKQLAMKASVQNKTDGLDSNYNFKETHSINPIDGRTDDGTALTKTNNISLGETAYDVVQQSDESDLEDVLKDPDHDEEYNTKLNLEMNEVHCNMGRTVCKTSSSSSDDGGSISKSSALSEQGHSQETESANNEEDWTTAGGGGDKSGNVALTQELSKTSLHAMEASPHQDQVHIPSGEEGLAPAGNESQ